MKEEESILLDDEINVAKHDELVYFNVSGRCFVTTSLTLQNFPDSLLACRERRNLLPRTKNDEIFLNLHPEVFDCVLTFYQCGILEQPTSVNQLIFVKDIKYYRLENEALETGMQCFRKRKKANHNRKWMTYLWNVLEYPDSSVVARIVSLISLLIIIVSIVIFCVETLPEYRKTEEELTPSKRFTKSALNDVEAFCIIYFTLEIVLRFAMSPNKCRFVVDILNLIDLVSILPFYVTLIFNMNGDISIYFLRAVRLVRVFRIFKLSRHSNEMKILGIAVKDSARELGVLVFFILLGVLLFSSAVYYAEDGIEGSKLTSIPGSFWWSIVTMTTVGYGDETPISQTGRFVGAICAMTGILVIAMPIPIIVNNFTRQYQVLKPASKYWHKFNEREKKSKNGLHLITDD